VSYKTLASSQITAWPAGKPNAVASASSSSVSSRLLIDAPTIVVKPVSISIPIQWPNELVSPLGVIS